MPALACAGRQRRHECEEDEQPPHRAGQVIAAAIRSATMTIRKLLVANRGEIAVRIFRTCRELGIATVAVAAPDDGGALHARSADETVAIASYLHSEEHIRAATASGADAIHPGYGFLAENADFAEAVDAAGLTWVGPPPEALRLGGDKLAAKRIAAEAGVPVVPTGEPAELGYPLLVKAAAGGGGRGMRVVREPEELDEALAAAAREAEAAFGDGTVFCERYVERPRHVEIQLLADAHGTVLSLGERDCSVQRRHQKVLEESPSPALDPELRAEMSAAAVAFARAIGYAERRHGRVHARRPRVLVPRAERPDPGRAPRDRARHRRRPRRASSSASQRASDLVFLKHKLRATRSRCGSTRRTRAASCPQAGTVERLRLPTQRPRRRRRRGRRRGRHLLRPDDREADRARADAGRGARAPRRRARRDRGRGRDHEPAVPPLARLPPGGPRRRGDDGVPDRASAPVRAAAAPARRPVARRLAAQPPARAARRPHPTSTAPHTSAPPAPAAATSPLRCRER